MVHILIFLLTLWSWRKVESYPEITQDKLTLLETVKRQSAHDYRLCCQK